MIEIQVVAKLALAQTLWEDGYGNDAQGVLDQAAAIAVDTEWEPKITEITAGYEGYDTFVANFIEAHPLPGDLVLTKDTLVNWVSVIHGNAFGKIITSEQIRIAGEFEDKIHQSDADWKKHVSDGITNLIAEIDVSVSDKLRRRNLQIADLKRKTEFHPKSTRAGRSESLADFEARRKTFIEKNESGDVTWACGCGSKDFRLMGSNTNIKAVCTNCGNSGIIAWYPSAHDSSAGSVKNLTTGEWEHGANIKELNEANSRLTNSVTLLSTRIGKTMVLVEKTMSDFAHENVNRETPSLKQRFIDIKDALLRNVKQHSGVWTRCSCGHSAQEHVEVNGCSAAGCRCKKYDGDELPLKGEPAEPTLDAR